MLKFIKNLFRRAFYSFIFPGNLLTRDYTLSERIEDGYEDNPTVFGAANKIATKAANIKLIPMKGENESDFDPLKEAFKNTRTDYSLKEFRRHWHLFRLLLGESLVYAPRYSLGGNDQNKPMTLDIMPPQNIEIETGGAADPIRYYKVESDERIDLEPEDVYHSRAFLNLDFDEGKQFRGFAPLAVASTIIRAMNAGNKTVADLYEAGMPPFMLYNEDLEASDTEEAKRELEKAWRGKSKDIPVLGSGKLGKIDLGFSNLRDLQIVETDKRGLRMMCNIWGLHPALFSDEAATLDNMKVSRKLMYEDRLMPDIEDECEYLNRLFEPLGIHYEPDYSKIEALQEDKEKVAKIYAIGMDKRAITKNEFREAIGLEPIEDDVMGEEGLIESAMFVPPVEGIDENGDDEEKAKKLLAKGYEVLDKDRTQTQKVHK